ncbi:MAG: type II toxin-antitoxin system prevent-host-death family antitoxin [Nitriliruptor sp.]|uniref:type II toxin-antitoxin system Phd/YefM family antitoxin n=1 Tax=Nitriliruptor sp. TaxID=2448056 RepID=UPI00349FE4E2
MEVGVRELKQRLSEYLDRAARGERITVTERGRPKALLVPLAGGDHIQRGIDEGWITPPTEEGGLPAAPRRARATVTVAEMIAEDRGT